MSVIVRSLFLTLTLLMAVSGRVVAQEAPDRLIPGEPVVGEMAAATEVTWLMEGQAGEVLILSAERFPPDPDTPFDPLLSLYTPDGLMVASDDDSGPGVDALLMQVTLPMTGTYRVVLRNQGGWGSGSYLLEVAESPFPPECETPFGTMLTGEMPTRIGYTPVRYRVFLPPCHELNPVRYPYVLLMHGSNTDDSHFDRLGADAALARGVALNRLPPMVLVLPFGGGLANTNIFQPGASWEYAVLDEIVPFMEAEYCLLSGRENRAIGGISRGGFWAFLIAFRHPDQFSILGGHSPFFDLYHAPPSHNPLDLVLATPPNPPLRIWMDRGKDDYAQLNIDLIHDRMQQNGIAHTYQLYPVGQHADSYWGAHVEEYLRFYGLDWVQREDELPPCLPEEETLP